MSSYTDVLETFESVAAEAEVTAARMKNLCATLKRASPATGRTAYDVYVAGLGGDSDDDDGEEGDSLLAQISAAVTRAALASKSPGIDAIRCALEDPGRDAASVPIDITRALLMLEPATPEVCASLAACAMHVASPRKRAKPARDPCSEFGSRLVDTLTRAL